MPRQQELLKLTEKYFNSFSVISLLLHSPLKIMLLFSVRSDRSLWVNSLNPFRFSKVFSQVLLSATNYNTRPFIGSLYMLQSPEPLRNRKNIYYIFHLFIFLSVYISIYESLCICMYVYVRTYVCMYVCMYVCLYLSI